MPDSSPATDVRKNVFIGFVRANHDVIPGHTFGLSYIGVPEADVPKMQAVLAHPDVQKAGQEFLAAYGRVALEKLGMLPVEQFLRSQPPSQRDR